MVDCRVDPEAGCCMSQTVDRGKLILAHRLRHCDPQNHHPEPKEGPPDGWAEKNECRTGPGGLFHFRRLIAANT